MIEATTKLIRLLTIFATLDRRLTWKDEQQATGLLVPSKSSASLYSLMLQIEFSCLATLDPSFRIVVDKQVLYQKINCYKGK